MRDLPDPHLTLRDTTDFIFDSALGRLSLRDPYPRNLAILLREVISLIYRLTSSCQLPEFTEHGLPHLCSLVDRICQWTFPAKSGAKDSLLEQLSPIEAGQLLLAVLVHDIGMLSQRPEDMPAGATVWQSKGIRDVSDLNSEIAILMKENSEQKQKIIELERQCHSWSILVRPRRRLAKQVEPAKSTKR